METSVFMQGSRSKEKPEVFNYWIQSVFCSKASHTIFYHLCLQYDFWKKEVIYDFWMQNRYFECDLNSEQMCVVSSLLDIVNFVKLF